MTEDPENALLKQQVASLLADREREQATKQARSALAPGAPKRTLEAAENERRKKADADERERQSAERWAPYQARLDGPEYAKVLAKRAEFRERREAEGVRHAAELRRIDADDAPWAAKQAVIERPPESAAA